MNATNNRRQGAFDLFWKQENSEENIQKELVQLGRQFWIDSKTCERKTNITQGERIFLVAELRADCRKTGKNLGFTDREIRNVITLTSPAKFKNKTTLSL